MNYDTGIFALVVVDDVSDLTYQVNAYREKKKVLKLLNDFNDLKSKLKNVSNYLDAV
ncbi:MAG: hypothetical protein NTZ39_08325 [Methanoregula sp.]|nr:hypothetical protein [Methanoregula sp.]